jgi:PAS domain S-box-containing protein
MVYHDTSVGDVQVVVKDRKAFMLHPPQARAFRSSHHVLGLMALGLALAWAVPLPPEFGRIEQYPAVHLMMEMVSVTVAMLVFVSGWHAYSRALPRNLVVLACMFMGVAVLDLAHALSYAGMPDFVTPSGPEKAINFWLVGRLMAALALLAAATLPTRPFGLARSRYQCLVAVVVAVGLAVWFFLFHSDQVPRTFVMGQGLTPFKIGAEFTVVGINVVTALILWRNTRRPMPFDVYALLGAVTAMALSECFFTLYTRVDDVHNFLGHAYKIISYAFLYRAVFMEVVESPYRQLARLSDQLRATLEAVPDVLLEMDLRGRYCAVYSRSQDQLVQPVEHLLGKAVQDVMDGPAAQQVMNALQEAMVTGSSGGKLLTLQTPQGLRCFELSVSRKGEQAGWDTRFIMLSRDVTERQQAEEARRSEVAALQASRAKSEFLSRMSHELRTPLNAVIGFAQLLLIGEPSKLPATQQVQVGHILKAGQHLLSMVDDILDLTRIESGRSDLALTRVQLSEVVSESLAMITPQARKNRIHVVAGGVEQSTQMVMANALKLKQVLINVLSNAVKYNREGGELTVALLPSDLHEQQCELVITDTGIGLSAEQLKGLFEPFNRLGAERLGIEGAGLGLLISRRLIESMGGSITVFSTKGVGAAVTLHLPKAAHEVTASVSHGVLT